ncbi:hypothetical protein DRO61_00235 [Candidatus Bathyarchaeota archaeon]|nr:MAG: hypothetical protein DRO61_00235 [Candidatus Bathyarchaeota archaeon]
MAKKKKLNLYATINRGATMKHGTKVRLNWDKHTILLRFLQERYQEMIDLKESSPDTVPSFSLIEEDWNVIKAELSEKEHDFTKIYYGAEEVCIICVRDYRSEIMDFELLREESVRQQKVKEEMEKEEEKKSKKSKKKK